MRKNILLPQLFFSILLVSCQSTATTVLNEDYQTNLDIFKTLDEVRVLQLTDIHWSQGTNYKVQEAYIKALVAKADPDILIATGDNVLGGTKNNFTHLYDLFDSLTNARGEHVYWSITWGNHDRQGFYDPDYPSNTALTYTSGHNYVYGQASSHYGLYQCPNDTLYGRSNYLINLTDGDKTVWQLWGIDSNSDYFTGTHYEYDVIHEDQIEWFTTLSKETRNEENTLIPSLAFFHIPLFQTTYSYYNAKNGIIQEGDYGGSIRESDWESSPLADQGMTAGIYSGYKDTGFYQAAKENGVKGMFYGHDHINDFWALYDENATADNNPNGNDDDILLAYGIKTGDGLYYQEGLIGGNLMILHKDGSFDGHKDKEGSDFSSVYLSYEEVSV